MGDINFENISNISKKQSIREILEITKPTNTLCEHCQYGKQTKVEFMLKEYSTKKSLEISHLVLCGKMRTKGINGEKYLMLLINDYTRTTWVCFFKKKSKYF